MEDIRRYRHQLELEHIMSNSRRRMRNIYVASSWRNQYQQDVVKILRVEGHEVYDFRDHGFSWSSIDPNWEHWTLEEYTAALKHPLAQAGYQRDYDAMCKADTCVMVLPCGNSAHIEAGWFAGANDYAEIDQHELYILALEQTQPDLMYKLATKICTSYVELINTLA